MPRRASVATAAVLLAMALVPAFGDSFATTLATRALIFGLAALGLDVVVGLGGMVSFGHAAFFGLGAYVVLLASFAGVNEAAIVWPLAIAFAGLAALAIGVLSLQTSGPSFIMITLAFAQMIFFIVSSIPDLGGSDGFGLSRRNTLAGMPLDGALAFHAAVLVTVALVLLLTQGLAVTPFGRAVSGIRQNERRMRVLGYNPFGYKLACFTYGGAVAGLAGALIANHTLYVSPENLHWMTSGTFLVMVVIGGQGTLLGALVGAAALLLLEEMLSAVTEHWMLILGPILVLLVIKAERGLGTLLVGRADARSA
jgi:branched-chain amino acid transport system permease protein